MREYKFRAITHGDFQDYIIKLHEKETRDSILDNYNIHSEDSVCWGKEMEGFIYYSMDEIFNTEKLDATHLVIFMK